MGRFRRACTPFTRNRRIPQSLSSCAFIAASGARRPRGPCAAAPRRPWHGRGQNAPWREHPRVHRLPSGKQQVKSEAGLGRRAPGAVSRHQWSTKGRPRDRPWPRWAGFAKTCGTARSTVAGKRLVGAGKPVEPGNLTRLLAHTRHVFVADQSPHPGAARWAAPGPPHRPGCNQRPSTLPMRLRNHHPARLTAANAA